jgi:hypothetical protein
VFAFVSAVGVVMIALVATQHSCNATLRRATLHSLSVFVRRHHRSRAPPLAADLLLLLAIRKVE